MVFNISRSALSAVAILWLAGIAWSASLPPRNAPSPLPPAAAEASDIPMRAPNEKVLRTTIFRNNVTQVATTGGFQAVHGAPIVVTCPGPGTCAIEVDQYMQVGNSAAAGNRFAVCSTIDGVFISQPRCPFLGFVPTTGFVTGAFMQFKTAVTPGDHNVQTFLYTDGAATRSFSSNAYRVFKP